MTTSGYIRIEVDGRLVMQHRLVMEKFLGRKLTDTERIHHINGDKADNRIENLELSSNHSQHIINHHADMWRLRKIRPEVPPEVIEQIMQRLALPGETYKTCFCGKKIMGRNLCERHYFWARYHHQFVSRPYHKRK
jgi:hypothetical protein